MTAPETEYASLKVFYDDRPERRLSGEADYGVMWRHGNANWRLWRVSYVQATGEVYAVPNSGQQGPVRVLGVVPPDQEGCYYATLDRVLDGYANPDVSGFRLSWVKGRLNDRGQLQWAKDQLASKAASQKAAQHG